MILFLANWSHYIDHVEHVYKSLKMKKRLLIPKKLENYAIEKGLTNLMVCDKNNLRKKIKIFKNLDPVLLVLSYSWVNVLNKAKLDTIFLEHGAGQTYITDNISWNRGECQYIKLALVPNGHCAKAFEKSNIEAQIIGCPKIRDDYEFSENEKPLVVFSWHWECKVLPETLGSFDYWKDEILNLKDKFNIAIHAHPVMSRRVALWCKRNDLRFIKQFDDVVKEADLYCMDNSSTLFEFARIGKPVLVLNPPWFRRDVEHGLRFWELSNIGVNCNDVSELEVCLEKALKNQNYNSNLSNVVYPYIGKEATEKAVEAINIYYNRR